MLTQKALQPFTRAPTAGRYRKWHSCRGSPLPSPPHAEQEPGSQPDPPPPQQQQQQQGSGDSIELRSSKAAVQQQQGSSESYEPRYRGSDGRLKATFEQVGQPHPLEHKSFPANGASTSPN